MTRRLRWRLTWNCSRGWAGRDWIHVARARCDVWLDNPRTRHPRDHCRNQCRGRSQARLAVRLAARLTLLSDRLHKGLVPSWPGSASQGSTERLQSEGVRTVDHTCWRLNATSTARKVTLLTEARRQGPVVFNLELIKSARTTAAGAEEASTRPKHLPKMRIRKRWDASPSRRL
jgi:hypothetical protein